MPYCPLDGTPLQRLSQDPLVGEILADRYLIEKEVGEGGMGRVYRARHTRMSRLFALKVLFGDFLVDPKMRERFSREAEAACRLSHANVVSVLDVGTSKDGLVYLAMDYVEGRELADLIFESGPLEIERAVEIAIQLCDGLEHAHEQGLVHRDFKCENIILTNDHKGREMPRIVDFGIAVVTDSEDQRLTTEGLIVGTPAAMSPEQATGETLDHRSDLYSLGVVIYQMVTGAPPFTGEPLEVVRQALSLIPPPMSERLGTPVPQWLEDICARLMEKRADDRYPNAGEVAEALRKRKGRSVAVVAPPHVTENTDYLTKLTRKRSKLPHAIALTSIAAIALTWFVWRDDGKKEGAAVAQLDDPPSSEVAAEPLLQAEGQGATAASGLEPMSLSEGAESETSSENLDGGESEEMTQDETRIEEEATPPSERRDSTTLNATSRGSLKVSRKASLRNEETEQEKLSADTSRDSSAKDPAEGGSQQTKAEPQAELPTTRSLRSSYISIGERIEALRATDPKRANALAADYKRIPFIDALRNPGLRTEVLKSLADLEGKLP